MEIVSTLIIILLVVGSIALWKFHVPGTILWGGIGIIVYLGFVVNEMDKGVPFEIAIYTFSIIGIAGLILLIFGLFMYFNKK
jgi:hypothetical protein|tara:strand:- start:545 stop:790 length:246 start_codon:yes stop_codon:yes gene_type:complete